MSEWQKIASVTTGGKPYFYMRAYVPHRLWFRVVWDRWVRAYAATKDNPTQVRGDVLGYFSTPCEAMRACDKVQS